MSKGYAEMGADWGLARGLPWGLSGKESTCSWAGGLAGGGSHVNPWLIHANAWQKPLQYCKVISLQIIKINGKKKKKGIHRNAGDISLISWLGRSPGEGNDNPL